jgi:nucleotide-binding universal stress UspA family protein
MGSSIKDLHARLPELMLRDQHRLRRRIDGLRRVRDAAAREKILAEVAADVDADLIVVGTHGGGLLRCILRGSVATRLLRRHHPLLVVH